MSTTGTNVRTYETICLTKVDMPDDKFQAMVDRCQEAIKAAGSGEWLFTDDWGRAKIAYPIKKDNRARWSYFRFKSTGAGVDELKRTLRINEFVLRETTARASEDAKDYTSLRSTIAQDLNDKEKFREKHRERRGDRPMGGRGRPRYRDDVEAPGHGSAPHFVPAGGSAPSQFNSTSSQASSAPSSQGNSGDNK
jgi:small subunit ribosomal protein S6